MLNKQMRRAYLPIFITMTHGVGGRVGGCGVVEGHVCFNFLGVGAWGWFPAGFFCRGVEVVGEVFGVGVADFPGWGEACFFC